MRLEEGDGEKDEEPLPYWSSAQPKGPQGHLQPWVADWKRKPPSPRPCASPGDRCQAPPHAEGKVGVGRLGAWGKESHFPGGRGGKLPGGEGVAISLPSPRPREGTAVGEDPRTQGGVWKLPPLQYRPFSPVQCPRPLSHHILIFKIQQGRLLQLSPTHLEARGGDRRAPTSRAPSPLAPHSPGPPSRARPPTRSAAARPRCPAYSAPG